ncbi:E3 ubiquitin-protein ligase MIB2-like [Littorina saxatilis]|uniref:Poly [ADP-ribose] polymerase n=1 Tax=Littorina saxatilis TaxID=31220 RepID=A0AAN9AWM1_9CAEN
MATKTGMRVVRGPNWSHGSEDGGEGHLGTVVSIPGRGPSYGKVQVVWDCSGEEKSYFAGKDDKFELLLFDIAQIGVKHKSVTCDACKTDGIAGIRWKCVVCTDYDLCSLCYHSDRHDRAHSFVRCVTDDCMLVKVAPRNASVKKEFFGLVKGAEVVRGPHWNFGNQDGGPGKRGKIVDIGTFSGGHYRGGARVQWEGSPDNILGYKVGAEGKVDLVAKSTTKGGTYYPEHLPRLDIINPEHVHLKRGDKVKVGVDKETFRKLQKENQSGWNDGMKQCCEEIGTIVAMPSTSVVRLQYEDARNWSVVRSVLQRLGTFHKGDKVKILESYNAAVELQVGHGGWNDKMEEILGKVGSVLEIDNDGDLRLEVDGYRWLVSPVSCTVLYDPNQKPREPTRTEVPAGQDVKIDPVRPSPDLMSFCGDNHVAEFFTAAEQGDLNKVKAFVSKNKAKVNTRVKGNAVLHVASYHGHRDIVKYLLDNGAEVNAKDEDGLTPLLFAIDGEQTSVIEELCKRGADKSAADKSGLTALHRAVDQELVECVRILVNNGADVNVQDKDLDTPMHDAIRKDNREIIKALLDCDKLDGTKTNKDKLNIMHVAVIHGLQRVVEVLISRNTKLASITGGPENWSPLHMAAMNGRTAVAGVLVKKGDVDVNAVDKNNRSALHYAVQTCENTIIDLLLGRDANPSIQDVDGNTPSHLAQMPKLPTAAGQVKKADEEVLVQSILCMLAECGADLNKKNRNGQTPLSLCKTVELVKKLTSISDRVKSERREKDDLPPHWTSMKGRELIVQELLSNDPLTAEEYFNVKHKFLRTMANVEVLSIKRIQNRSLWDAYHVNKRTMERRYGLGCANELSLFHGTPAEAVEPIQHQNIDPLLAGSNVGAIWGKGAYFAVDAKQSDNYASASDEGFRYMFMARVLAGRHAQGQRGMQRPPPVDQSNQNELADTVVDNTDQPRIYVVFRNQQIYPEFLVQYM